MKAPPTPEGNDRAPERTIAGRSALGALLALAAVVALVAVAAVVASVALAVVAPVGSGPRRLVLPLA